MLEPVLESLYDVVHQFLEEVVQPQLWSDPAAPHLDLQLGFTEAVTESLESEREEWLTHLRGYIVVLAASLLFIIILITSGCVLCCCSCCKCCKNKCRTDDSLRDGRCSKCARTCCSLLLLLIAIILFVCVVVSAYATVLVWRQTDADDGAISEMTSHMYSVVDYTNDTAREINDVVVEDFDEAFDDVTNTLTTLGAGALQELDDATSMGPLLDALDSFAAQLTQMETSLSNAATLTTFVDLEATALEQELATLCASVAADADLCAGAYRECDVTLELAQEVRVVVDYSTLPTLDTAVSGLQVAIAADVEQQTTDAVAKYAAVANDVDAAFAAASSDVTSTLQVLDSSLAAAANRLQEFIPEMNFTDAIETLSDVTSDVDTYGSYWFFVSLALCSVLLVILFCFLFSLCCACCCPLPSADDSRDVRSTRSTSRCLTCGTTLVFLVTWLHMLVCMLYFASGGLAHNEICRYVSPLTSTSPALGAIETLHPDTPTAEVTLTSLVAGCEADESLYELLHLNSTDFDFSSYCDLSAFDQALQTFCSVSVVTDLSVYSTALNSELESLTQALATIDYTAYYDVMAQSVTSVDLREFVTQLEETAVATQDLPLLSARFADYALQAQALYDDSVVVIEQSADDVTTELQYVEAVTSDAGLTQLTSDLTQAQLVLDTSGDDVITAYIGDTCTDINSTVYTYYSETSAAVTNDIGACRSVFDALADTVAVVCEDFLNPYNALWFAQMLLLVLLLPSLALARKLARLFRHTHRYGSVEPCASQGSSQVNMETDDVELQVGQHERRTSRVSNESSC